MGEREDTRRAMRGLERRLRTESHIVNDRGQKVVIPPMHGAQARAVAREAALRASGDSQAIGRSRERKQLAHDMRRDRGDK
jgi:outer membrane lipopolysaccharide assembly protein LptE/RlpB